MVRGTLLASSTSYYSDSGLVRLDALLTVSVSWILDGHEFEETARRVSSSIRFIGRRSRKVRSLLE